MVAPEGSEVGRGGAYPTNGSHGTESKGSGEMGIANNLARSVDAIAITKEGIRGERFKGGGSGVGPAGGTGDGVP